MGGLVLATALLGWGCEGNVAVPPVYRSVDGQPLAEPVGRGLVVRSNSPLADVPMPVGFVYVQDKSKSKTMAGVRYVQHLYQGRAELSDAVDFYRRQPALQGGWVLVSEQSEKGDTVLRFNKGRENLEVRVSEPDKVVTVWVMIQGAPATQPK